MPPQQTFPLVLWHTRETAMTSQLSSRSPTTVSREEIAKRAAARMRQKGLALPDTEEWAEARREPLTRVVVTIRARFEGPKVRARGMQVATLNKELTRVGRQKVFWRYFRSYLS